MSKEREEKRKKRSEAHQERLKKLERIGNLAVEAVEVKQLEILTGKILKRFDNVSELGNNDTRIKGRLNKNEIENYFKTSFSEKQKDSGAILTEEEINQFLRANFKGFEPKTEVKKFDTPNTTQQKLRGIIYDFYLKDCKKMRTSEYVKLLINNFYEFDGTDFKNEKKNFSKK
ncbi:MAG TPA: hypothetical protein VN026_05590 [Bacteroidia bacterium]|jgi:hypothetical protein|nr:hypothetical protein [Bacteroidia bacterium]